MKWFNKKRPSKELFPIIASEQNEHVARSSDDQFFEEAFADHPHSAIEPSRSFVGSLIPKRRFQFISLFVLGVFFVFIGRASALQIVNGEEYRAQAEQNRFRTITLVAQRGIIYDRNGEVLAQNTPTFSIITSKEKLPTKADKRAELLARLVEHFELNEDDVYSAIDQAETFEEEIIITNDATYDQAIAFQVIQQEFPGIQLELTSKRSYVTDSIPSLSHILGYTGIINEAEYEERAEMGYRKIDHIGKHGVEQQYETILRGSFGHEIVEVDALGRAVRIISKEDPTDGNNLQLSIDASLQSEIEQILQRRMDGTEASRASVIAMNPKNGEVYSLVSWPAYDANLFTSGIDQETYTALIQDPRNPLFPRAYAGDFPSGSTIKPVFAAAALTEGIITPTTSFLSTGGLRISIWFFPDWRAGGHGPTNVYHAIADSVNTFFYLIGGGNDQFDGMGIEKLMEYAAQYGFGKPTGIDIPGEAQGFLPSKDWKLSAKGEVWYIGDTYHASIGQGDFLATPLQIAQSTAIFANDGVRVTPHVNLDGNTESDRVVSVETAKVIKDGMRRTVTAGSARSLSSVPEAIAGKTGTAQWASNRPNHSWFTGFAPFDDPEIVVTVLIEEGADDSLAVPVSRDIFEWWFDKNVSQEES